MTNPAATDTQASETLILKDVLARAIQDLALRYDLLTKPQATLTKYGIAVAGRVTFLENNAVVYHLILPPMGWQGQIPPIPVPEAVRSLLQQAASDLPLRYRLLTQPHSVLAAAGIPDDGPEFVFIDSSPEHTYIVLPPMAPGLLDNPPAHTE